MATTNPYLGPNDKSNVSCLSPYISHRLITEYEVAKIVLAKFPYQKVEKYIQEIFWRVYWKGWLELRPQVWSDFTEDLKALKEDDNYKKAINGETQIKCFNDWVNELKENNYLHNHTRMWFASIWIFTLNLPWQKGAEFFMKHLFDGDAASTTLSWRWVAGLQTYMKVESGLPVLDGCVLPAQLRSVEQASGRRADRRGGCEPGRDSRRRSQRPLPARGSGSALEAQ